MPFLAQKIMQLLAHILTKVGEPADEEEKEHLIDAMDKKIRDDQMTEAFDKRRKAFKAKMLAIRQMTEMLKTLQREKEAVLAIKNSSHDGRLPRGLLQDGKAAIKNAAKSLEDRFETVMAADARNERRPDNI